MTARLSAPADHRRTMILIVASGSLITSLMLGARSTFGLYLEPVVETLDTDRGTYALAIAIQNLLWGLAQPVSGAVADRFGSARVLAAGAVAYTLSLLLMASADSTGVLILSAGFLVGLSTGAASFAVVLSAVGRLVSPERRSLALGVVTAMGSVGHFVLVPVAQELVTRFGWRQAVVTIAVIVLAVVFITHPLRGNADQQLARAPGTGPDPAEGAGAGAGKAEGEREGGHDAGTRPAGAEGFTLSQDLRRAGHHRPYVLLNLAFFVCGFHVTFIATHLPSYVSDLGIDARAGATALSLIGLFNIFGSLAAGALGGRYSKTRLLAGIYTLRALFIAVYLLVPASAASTIVFGAAFGLLWLSTVPLTSGIVTAQFGARNAGALFGIVFLSHQLGAFVGVWLGGELADATGSYRLVWLIAMGLGLYAAVLHLLIDDGPAPAPPEPVPGGFRIAPGGATAAILLTAGLGALALSGGRPAAADGAAGVRSPTAAHSSLFCNLHGS